MVLLHARQHTKGELPAQGGRAEQLPQRGRVLAVARVRGHLCHLPRGLSRLRQRAHRALGALQVPAPCQPPGRTGTAYCHGKGTDCRAAATACRCTRSASYLA